MTLRSRLAEFGVRLASPAGTVARIVLAAVPGLLGLGLLSYGAWLAWPPAGPMVAGALLLVDQAYDRMKGSSES